MAKKKSNRVGFRVTYTTPAENRKNWGDSNWRAWLSDDEVGNHSGVGKTQVKATEDLAYGLWSSLVKEYDRRKVFREALRDMRVYFEEEAD